MIKFKNDADFKYWPHLHPKLQQRIEFMEWYYDTFFGLPLVITRIVEHDGSTHDQVAPYRFIDVRCSDIELKEAEKLRRLVNKIFPYGLNSKGKPTDTIVALDHGSAPHYHVQVPV